MKNVTHGLWPKLTILICCLVLALGSQAQDELVLKGYATTQGIEDLQNKPAADVLVRVYDDEGIINEVYTSLSGAFFFKLPLGSDYFVEWIKADRTTKRVLFDLIGVKPGDIKRSKLTFEMDVVLVETAYLTRELKAEAEVNKICWDQDSKEFVYTTGKIENYWDKFSQLQSKYDLAKKDAGANRTSKLIHEIQDDIVWPEDPGDSLEIYVLEDYETYVNLKMLQANDPQYKTSSVHYLEGQRMLERAYAKGFDILYASDKSSVDPKELAKMVPDNALFFSQGLPFQYSMVSLTNSMTDTKFEINDLALIDKGFKSSDELRDMPEFTVDKAKYDAMIAGAQNSMIDQKEKTSALEKEKTGLESEKQTLIVESNTKDSLIGAREREVLGLQSDIDEKGRKLFALNSMVGERNNALQAAQAIFEAKQVSLDNTIQTLEEKEARLKEFDDLLQEASVKFANQEDMLTESSKLLENQRNLNIAIGVVAIVITLLLIWAFSNYRRQRRYAIENDKQAKVLEFQGLQLKEKNTELNDSINYAKRIQDVMLPSTALLDASVAESFVYYEPKDIVAGDFYWIQKWQDSVYFAAADCTGHGVPGAMMTVVCHNAMNRAFRELGGVSPATLLDQTRKYVLEQLHSSGDDVKDGMDIALCEWNSLNNTMSFAGAHNPLWLFTKRDVSGELKEGVRIDTVGDFTLLEIKADKQPIGHFDDFVPFKNHSIKLEEGDLIYIFSDGFADQFGGKRGKKLKTKLFKELLAMSAKGDMKEQEEFISEYFINWRGDIEQIDDVVVIGVKV